MPEKKSQLAQMIIDEQARRGLTDREAAAIVGEQQQTFNTWKHGSLPRLPRPNLAAFLNVDADRLEVLVEEARVAATVSKLPSLAVYAKVSTYGRIADRKDGKFKFDTTRKAVPEGRYAIIVDTKVMEPAFKVGCKAWLDPGVWPRVGDDVVAHTRGGLAWIGRLEELADVVRLTRYNGEPVVVSNVAAVHVIVLAERV